ncbi:MAG: sodium:solute symporter family protein [Calditerrivibrio sp.]|nr:sodium:solute symporter family protein [Calditerrivibrio sp.]
MSKNGKGYGVGEFNQYILVGVIVYIVAMLIIGFWAGKYIKNSIDFVIAGRRLSFPLALGTVFATWFGAETVLGSSTTANKEGILGVIADPFGAGLCLIISGLFIAPALYKYNITTNIDFFERRFSKHVGFIMALIYLPPYIGWIGAQMLAFGTIFSAFMPIDIKVAILISAAVVITYTYSGGLYAVAVTDLVQMVFIVIGVVFLFIQILVNHAGQIVGIPSEMYSFFPNSDKPVDWLNYLEAWMIVGFGSLGGQDLVARILGSKNVRVARSSSITAGVLYWTLGLVPVLLGIWAIKLLPQQASSENSIIIDLAKLYLPFPLLIIFIGALLSAVMSTADTALLAPASLIGENLYPYFKKDATDEQKLKVCRISVVVIGMLSLLLALYFEKIYELCLESWTILLTSFTAPFLFAIFWKKTTAKGVITGSITGLLVWIFFSLMFEDLPSKMFGFLASCVAIILVSLVTYDGKKHTLEEF